MKSEIIEKLEERIADECKAIDREARYDDMLDDCYSFDSVGGPFAHMTASRVLKEMDPVAYRCGVNDYEDSEEWVEVGSSTYEQDDVEKVRDEFVDEIDSEITSMEDQIADAKADGDANPNLSSVASLEQKLHDLKADYEAVKHHTF